MIPGHVILGIEEIFAKNTSDHGFNPSQCLADCIEFLDQQGLPNATLDPRDRQKAQDACNAYGHAAGKFQDGGFRTAAEILLINGWNKFALVQTEYAHNQQVYKAGFSVYLSDTYLHFGDVGAALRWALYTQADDALVHHLDGGAKHRLETILGMSQSAISAFNTIATENADKIGNDWSKPHAFAEHVVMRFALKHPEYAHLLALGSSVLEFPLSQAYFDALLDTVKSSQTSQEKGKALEDLASYLFLLIPGWVPRRNVQEVTQAFETDIVVSNLSPASNLSADLFGRNFLVECKNWNGRVGSNQVGYFLYRMRLTHTKFGIIFATNGITGNRDGNEDQNDAKAARSLIQKAFHEDGSISIVVTQIELSRLAKRELSFWSMLLDKTGSVRFGDSLY